MGKARVGVRLKEAVGAKKPQTSVDLKQLTGRYDIFVKRLRHLISALKAHYGSLHQLAKTRAEIAYHVSVMSRHSPLTEFVGEMPPSNPSATRKDGAKPTSPSSVTSTTSATTKPNSFLGIHQTLVNKSKMYNSKYAQHVIDYAVEWEKVVTNRVTNGLKKVEELRVEKQHYQEKTEALRASVNQALSKGKLVDPKTTEKLTRNEEKLVKSKKDYERATYDMCVLMEEVTERSWRDIHPLIVKLAQFDITLADDESKTLSELNNVVNELKRVAATHGVKPQARLNDLKELDPKQLSTRQDDGKNTYALEMGADGALSPSSNGGHGGGGDFSNWATSPSSDNGGAYSNQALPPGSVIPQSMGGYPVAVQSASTPASYQATPLSRSSSFGSAYSGMSGPAGPVSNPPPTISNRSSSAPGGPPTTLDMLHISAAAAPPPTLDQVHAAVGVGPSGYGTLPTKTGDGSGIPPLGPGNRQRMQSQDSELSAYSGFSGYSGNYSTYSNYSQPSAAAPAAPPPPPPPQDGEISVPPTSGSYYGNNNVGGGGGGGGTNPFGNATPAPAPSTNPFGSAPNSYGAPPTLSMYPPGQSSSGNRSYDPYNNISPNSTSSNNNNNNNPPPHPWSTSGSQAPAPVSAGTNPFDF